MSANPDSPYYTGYVPHEPSAAERAESGIDLNEQIAHDEAALAEQRRQATVKLARRLVVAFILIALTAVGCWVVLPHYGLVLPPILPILAFATIVIGTVLAGAPEPQERRENNADWCDDGCTSCGCGGPRPIGEMSRRARRN